MNDPIEFKTLMDIRGCLINAKFNDGISNQQRIILQHLDNLLEHYRKEFYPLPMKEAQDLYNKLKRKTCVS